MLSGKEIVNLAKVMAQLMKTMLPESVKKRRGVLIYPTMM